MDEMEQSRPDPSFSTLCISSRDGFNRRHCLIVFYMLEVDSTMLIINKSQKATFIASFSILFHIVNNNQAVMTRLANFVFFFHSFYH